MADLAHALTDKEIAKIQRNIAGFYREAQKDVAATLTDYAKTIRGKADKLLKAVNDAEDEKTKRAAESDYKRFYLVDVKRDKQFRKAARKVSERLYEANNEAAQYINTKTAKTYTENYNQIGKGLQKDLNGYDFKPVTENEVEEYGQLTKQTVDKDKDTSWNEQNVINSVVSGALLFYAVDKIFNDTSKTVTNRNRESGNRQASDTMTDAENKGRLDSMYRADDEGFSVKKYWLAVKDNRTRDTHIEYDSMEPVELDFQYAPGLKRPKDPDCPDLSEVCNCRCTLLYDTGHKKSQTTTARFGEVTGSYKKSSSFEGTQTISIPNMSYKEWMEWRSR